MSGNAYVTNGVSAEQGLTCGLGAPGLTAGGALDFAVDAVELDVGASGSPNTDTLFLTGAVELAAADNISLDCFKSGAIGPGDIVINDIEIGALQVGRVHVP